MSRTVRSAYCVLHWYFRSPKGGRQALIQNARPRARQPHWMDNGDLVSREAQAAARYAMRLKKFHEVPSAWEDKPINGVFSEYPYLRRLAGSGRVPGWIVKDVMRQHGVCREEAQRMLREGLPRQSSWKVRKIMRRYGVSAREAERLLEQVTPGNRWS